MRPVVVRLRAVVLVTVLLLTVETVAQERRDVRMPVAACLQYQRVRHLRGTAVAPFRQYGFRRMMSPTDVEGKLLWGYQVRPDTAAARQKEPLYRRFRHSGIYSFAIIDDASADGATQYVFWAKGYYRRFASDLRSLGFVMSQDRRRPNVLHFAREDTGVFVDFIIWEDIYVMEVGGQ